MYIHTIIKTVYLVWTELTACACCEAVPCVNAPGEAGLGGCAYGKPDCPKKKQDVYTQNITRAKKFYYFRLKINKFPLS